MPSNIASDICDTPGATDLTVASHAFVNFDTSVPCDALVPQTDGLPDICVRKFATITIDGHLQFRPIPNGNPALAIVATNTISIGSSGQVLATGGTGMAGTGARDGDEAPGAPDGRGTGCVPASGNAGGTGAGHITSGGSSSAGCGAAYGPTSGTQLIAGSAGGDGFGVPSVKGGPGGKGGAGFQLVSCNDLSISGSVSADGAWGAFGADSVQQAGGGGGGGSGGTLLIEALRLTGAGSLLARGGSGGPGGRWFDGFPPGPSSPGEPGGKGGTGSSAPEPKNDSSDGFVGGGGAGGAIGRIVINLPQGAVLPDGMVVDPPASVGVIATH